MRKPPAQARPSIRRRLLPGLSALAAALLAQHSAWAGKPYLELGWGRSSISGAAPLLGTDASLGMADALNTSVGYDLADPGAKLHINLALHSRLISGTPAAGGNMAIATVMPLIRLEYKSIWVGTGATPLVWSRSGSAFSVQGLAANSGSIAAMGEVGAIYRASPEFALTASSGLFFAQTGATMGPAPAWDIQISARFYWISSQAATASHASGEYDYADKKGYSGWRYPFGRGL